jgi:rhodanese-related sulfurtransferase
VNEQVGIDELLERVRADLDRIAAADACEAAADGALLVDIRYAALRERDGLIPGALVVERNELEWRLDPWGSHRAPEATGHDLRVVVICNEGYASSLAAASLRQLGLHRATDLIGGFQAWQAAGAAGRTVNTPGRTVNTRGNPSTGVSTRGSSAGGRTPLAGAPAGIAQLDGR